MSEPGFLNVEHLSKTFHGRDGGDLRAVDDVSFDIAAGTCVGLVGESGSGKSTLANLILRFEEPDAGSIRLLGTDITRARGKQAREVYRHVQAVFQNPGQSFDPRRTLGDGIGEGLRNQGVSKREIRSRVEVLLERCGLSPEIAGRYPREVSGGQCQRAAIARALAMSPELLICDEATSALDVTVQQRIVGLLRDVQRQSGMSLLFISHDIALVSQVCERILVMKKGRLVERGSTAEVIGHPRDAYTRSLIDAVL